MNCDISNEKCDICGEKIGVAWDEDETLWCVECVEAWERKHRRYWTTGALITGDDVRDNTEGNPDAK